MTGVVTILLAAGAGRRMGGPKALLAWPRFDAKGRVVVDRPLAIAHAEARLDAESAAVLIVTRKPLVAALLRYVRPGIDLLSSDAPDALGPAGSLAFAVSRLPPTNRVIVTPVDTIPVSAETVARLCARLDAEPTLLAVRPSYEGHAGHPVVLRPDALDRYRAADPPPLRDHLRDLGDRAVVEEVDDPDVLVDLNTPVDAVSALARFGGPATLGLIPRFLKS